MEEAEDRKRWKQQFITQTYTNSSLFYKAMELLTNTILNIIIIIIIIIINNKNNNNNNKLYLWLIAPKGATPVN